MTDADLTPERAGALRDMLRDVDVPAETREHAIAAALALFDEIQGGDTQQTSPAPVVSLLDRRRRQYRWLGGAAAAAIVGIVAVGVVTSGDDTDNSTAFEAAPSTLAVASAPKMSGEEADSGDQTAADAAPADTIAVESSAVESEVASAEPAAGGAGSPPAPMAALPSFTTPDQIVVFVQSGFAVRTPDTTVAAAESNLPSTTAAPAPTAPTLQIAADLSEYELRCTVETELPSALVLYNGVVVVVRRVDVARQIEVIDATTCELLETIALP